MGGVVEGRKMRVLDILNLNRRKLNQRPSLQTVECQLEGEYQTRWSVLHDTVVNWNQLALLRFVFTVRCT